MGFFSTTEKTLSETETETKTENNNNNNNNKINNFLVNESIAKKKETWNKLDKSEKLNKLFEYAEKYNNENKLNDTFLDILKNFFIKCLDRKLLLKSKEVVYDIENNKIINIPNLLLNVDKKYFYLKKDDKHVSTIKNLPLEKKNKVKTIKIHE